MKTKAVCLDLDGTLFDTVPEMCEAANQVLADNNLAQVSEDTARSYVGDGLARFTKRVLTSDMWAEPSPDQFSATIDAIIDSYAKIFARRNSLYPGVSEALTTLLKAGWQLAVVTNKPERFTRPLLEYYLPEIKFASVVCGDMGFARKPNPAGLLAAVSELNVSSQRTIMVGDSIADARASRGAAIACFVAATYGYHRDDEMDDLKADFLLHQFNELPTCCEQANLK